MYHYFLFYMILFLYNKYIIYYTLFWNYVVMKNLLYKTKQGKIYHYPRMIYGEDKIFKNSYKYYYTYENYMGWLESINIISKVYNFAYHVCVCMSL